MSISHGIKGNYRLFGVRGLLATAACRLVGWPREIAVHWGNSSHRIYLRLRTSDISVYQDLLVHGAYDLGLPEFRPRTIVDAGANVGMAALYFTNQYPDAKVVAVEPEPSNYAMLVKNVAAYPNIVPFNAALWSQDGYVNLGLPGPESTGREKWAFAVVPFGGVQVRAVTMRTLMRESNFDAIDLLKMDIEGGEREVFGTCDWIDLVKAVVIELHDRIKPGCREIVTAAAKEFTSWERGEMTFFVRRAS